MSLLDFYLPLMHTPPSRNCRVRRARGFMGSSLSPTGLLNNRGFPCLKHERYNQIYSASHKVPTGRLPCARPQRHVVKTRGKKTSTAVPRPWGCRWDSCFRPQSPALLSALRQVTAEGRNPAVLPTPLPPPTAAPPGQRPTSTNPRHAF